ncbi:copper resistance CopC family protein [Reyranella sp.]|uniref:copper resistance CopC family protein n=1 Tax=Reyranella sp. TaxID=1929291 RepID=UPI004035211A
MMKRRLAIAALLAAVGTAGSLAQAQQPSDDVRVMESTPAAHARIGARSSAFFVRFDRPVDHIKSTLVITQGGKVIERLHPRLESSPQVLFAAAPTLPPGDYMLHWTVVTIQGTKAVSGDIPFQVTDQQ